MLQACQYAPSLRRRRQHLPTARPAHRELRLPSRSSHLDSSLCFQPIYKYIHVCACLKNGEKKKKKKTEDKTERWRRRWRRRKNTVLRGCCRRLPHKKGGKYYWWQYCVRDSSNRSTSLYPTLFVPATENGDERTACWCCDLNQQHDNDRAGM